MPHLCKFEGCTEDATAGKFGHTYCESHNEQVKAEKEREKENKKNAPPPIEPDAGLGGVRTEPRRSTRRRGRADLTEQIKDAVMMTAAVAAVKDYRILVAVEATVDEFAVSWNNVAVQSPAARKYIEAMLSGGVWISAFGSSLVMAVTVMTVTEKLPPNLAPLGYVCVKKAGLEVQQHEPNANGNGAVPEPEPAVA